MVLTTSARDARRMVDALVPLARAGEARRQARQGAPLPPESGRAGTVTVTVASTGVRADRARGRAGALPASPRRSSSRTCTGAATSVPRGRRRRSRTRPARLAGDVDAPEHEPGHLLALGDALGRRSAAAASRAASASASARLASPRRAGSAGSRPGRRPTSRRPASTCLPGFARVGVPGEEERRAPVDRAPVAVDEEGHRCAAFAPHGRTRSFTGPRTFVHGRAPALVSANALLSTTIVFRAMS